MVSAEMGTTIFHMMAMLLLVLLMGEADAQRCGDVDLGFVLDTSGSLAGHFDEEKTFLKRVARHFRISADGSHEGVVSFSNTATLDIKLTEHKSQESFEDAVDRIRLVGSYTRIDKGLRMAQNELFHASNGARWGNKRIGKALVVITDGTQTKEWDAEDPGAVADEMRAAGFNIVVVGVGSQITPAELDHIAGGDGKSYRAATFEKLLESDFVEKVVQSTCVKPPSCTRISDIGFVLDSSGSLVKEYHKEKDFLKRVAKMFGISEDGHRAGVVTFSYDTELSIKFNTHYDQASFESAVDAIPFLGQSTRIDKALTKVDNELYAEGNGARLHAAKYVILITDGAQSRHRDAVLPGKIAAEMRSKGYHVIVLGVGPHVDPAELLEIADKKEMVFRCTDFDALLGFVSQVEGKLNLCGH